MKKYLNKGLLYQWFNAAKVPIMIGLVAWGFIAYEILNSDLGQVQEELSRLHSDYFRSACLRSYICLGVIFMAIQFVAVGVNKRNTIMFLSSGPYTKKQIKYNELIALLITLVLFIITFIYIAITFYIRNVGVLSIITGYARIIILEIVRLTLIGTIGIVFMMIIDILFSNSVIGFIGMIFVIPASIVLTFGKISSILSYWGVGNDRSLTDKIHYLITGTEQYNHNPSALLDSTSLKFITIKRLSAEIIIAMVVIMLMIVIFNIAQKKYNLGSGNKIFSSKSNENIVVLLTSIGIANFINLLFLDNFEYKVLSKTGRFAPAIGMDLIKLLMIDAISIVVGGFIAYKIIKKILKAVV